MIFQANKGPQNVTALRDPSSKQIKTDPTSMLDILTRGFKGLMTSSFGAKTGKFLPQESPREYPWQPRAGQAKPLDGFTLETQASNLLVKPELLGQISNREIFDRCLKHAANHRAPGPDTVPNEVLKHAPAHLKEVINSLFIIICITQKTPPSWLQSTTVLLYKKGDPLEWKNYRPIALANCLYKLWTSVLTEVLSTYAESNGVLCSTQEGFRTQRNTARQLQNMTNVLEDARLTGSNLYTVYVDFSSAFDMADHDRLLQVMYDLGFPCHILDVVKHI